MSFAPRSASSSSDRATANRARNSTSPNTRRCRPARCLAFDGLLLRLLAMLDDVAFLEEDAECDLPPQRGAPQQELQVHAEVLELLALGIAHDRPCLKV